MSAVTALFLIFLWQTSFLHNEAALVVFAPSPQRAQLGENMVLPCSFRVDDNPINLQYLAILWLFQGNEILRIDNKGELSQPRMFINKQDITKGIANMEIKNVTISDIGKYRCMVIYSPQKESRDIDLSVYATPSVVIEQVEKEDKMNIALCSVTGFYPRDISVEMLQDRTIIEDSVLSEYHTNADGTYSVNWTWKIPTDVSPKILSCSVHHETLTTPVQKDLQLIYQGNNDNTGVVVGCIVGIIIILIPVAVLFIWYCKRKSDHQKFMMKDIECPIWSDGEKTTLSCEAFNCTGDVTMTWVIKFKDGTQHEVSDTGSNDNEEDQPLMSREYQVTKEYDSMKGHVTTKLTFIPSISRHLGSAVSCRIVHQKKPVEKTLEVKTIHAKPKFIEPVQFTLSDQEKVQISVKLQRFYPQEMEVTWFSKRGQSEEEIPGVMNNNHNSGDTFDLDSKCTVPGELFKDPKYKVIVRWKHKSMEEPQSREISARDLPWHPKLQKFPIESIFQGDKVLLQCRVSDYFPNSLAVKWLERKMGSQELVEISSSQKYKIPEISSYRMENKTISSTAVLSYKRFDLSEKGVEFICKVEHPTLDTPIQTSIVQYRDTEAPTFILNNIQGPQIWFSGEKITLYCAASYCMEGTQVIWMVKAAGVTISEIGEDGTDVKRGSHQSSGYVAHRERTEVSDKEGLQDVTTSLTFTPSISKHQNISITCRILCDRKVKEKTFQRQYLYAKPSAPGPIKLSLTDCGEVLCSLDIEGFYPSDIQMKWNDKETSEPNRTSQNGDGTYSFHSEYKVPGSFFSHPGFAVRVSWKHGSMEDWESREMSVRDTGFPWKPDIQDIAVPNLLSGRMATLKCKVSNVFPDALSVKWLKKEKGGQELFPVISSQTYNISELRLEKQKDNTFIYTNCLMFQPSIDREEGVEFICRVEHPTLAEPAEKSTGPLTIKGKKGEASTSQNKHQDSSFQIAPELSVDGSVPPIPPTDEETFIVGEIQGPCQWIHGEKLILHCAVSDCSKDTRVIWMVEQTDGRVEEISNTGGKPLIDSGYMVSKETEKSDRDGLLNLTSSLILVPSASKHVGIIIACKISSGGQTETKKFKPKSIYAKPQIMEPVKTSLCDGGDVLCSLNLQNVYPKHIKLSWGSGEEKLKSEEKFEMNNDHTYSVQSRCTVPGNLLLNPNFSLHVTWNHKFLDGQQSRVLSWRDPGLSWCPVIEEVPIPHVLIERQNTFQYNISGYCPDAVTVSWYRKEKGSQEYVSLSHNEKYRIPDIQSQRQSDHTYSCTARLLFTPFVKDGESEIMCRVSHPSLERPLERRSGPLRVQAKPKMRKPIKASLGSGEVMLSYVLENFYPKHIQIQWCYWSGGKPEHCPSKDQYKPNLNKTISVTSGCTIPEKLLHHPDFRIRMTWRHESMEEEEYKEFSIRDKDFPWRPHVEMSVPPLRSSEEATIQCTVTKYFPDALNVKWLRKDKQSREMYPVSSDGMYRITNTLLGRQNDKTYGCRSCVTFSPSLERDQDVEYICRVEHPSLEQPIERSTGALQVTAPEQQKPCIQHPQPHSSVPALVSHHPSPQYVSNIMDHQHQADSPAPEPHHSTPQDVSNIMDHQHQADAPAPEPRHLTPQDVSNIMDHQHYPDAPATEPHLPTQQDLSNIMAHRHHPDAAAPEPHHPTPLNVSNKMDHPYHQAPESQHPPQQVVYIIMDHQHQNDFQASNPHHPPPQNVSNIMQNHPDVPAYQSQQPYPQEVYTGNMMGCQHYPGALAPESHHLLQQDMNNMEGYPNIPISQQHYSPLPNDEDEEMDVQTNIPHSNVVEHREQPAQESLHPPSQDEPIMMEF